MHFSKAKDAQGLLAERLSDFQLGEVELITESRVEEFVDDIQRWCDWMDEEHRNAFLTGLLSSLGATTGAEKMFLNFLRVKNSIQPTRST